MRSRLTTGKVTAYKNEGFGSQSFLWDGDVSGFGVRATKGTAKKPNGSKASELVSNAIITKMNPLSPLVKTLTFDNGKEFAEHARIDTALQSTTYFADPCASWQRGSNENFNGLLRQYIPKKRPLSTVTEAELRMIEDKLNNRPRKRLGFKTPNEVFMQSLNRVALRV